MEVNVNKPRTLEQVAAQEARHVGPRCKVCILPPEVRKKIEKARATAAHSYDTIARWLRDELGHAAITTQKVGNHFREHVNAGS